MKPPDQTEPAADLTPGHDRAMHGLLHEFASHQTTDDDAFLSALETALDNADSKPSVIPLAEPIAAQKPSHRWWKWGLAGSAAACAVGMLVWREAESEQRLITAKNATPSEPEIATAGPLEGPLFEVKEDLNASVDDVISSYEKITGVTVLQTGNIKGIVPIKGTQAVKLNKAQIVAYYKTALLEKGLSVHEYSPKLHALTYTGQSTPLFRASPSVVLSASSVTPGVGGTSTPNVQYMPYAGDRVVHGPVQFGSLASGSSTNNSWAQLMFNPTDRTDLQSSTDKYNPAIENPFLSPLKAPLSTFSVDVDTASYANLRRMIQEGQTVPPAAVRIEEMVNYFTYDYPQPDGAHPFSVSLETASCPWAPTHRLVKIGLKAKEIAKEKRPSANLVFLCDVSGSMNTPDRLPLLVENLKVLTNELNADDTVGIVVYAGNQGVALPPTSGGDKETILKALSNLSAGGSTNGGAGITRAYEMAQERFVKGGINRVVLCTDGDFNVGTTSQEALVNLVKEKAAGGVFLTVCGYGRGNLNDGMLESITDKGNGVYHYVDSEKEGKKIFKDELFGTLMTVAKDVKLQVEFNPDKVGSYRLVGYDNRMLKKEDFANDKVDAGDIGAGHSVTALYEVIPPGVDEPQKPADDLKYQKGQSPVVNAETPTSKAVNSPEMLTVKLRYKEPEGTESKLLEVPHTDAGQTLATASSDFKFASAVAEFGERLRGKRPEGRSPAMILEQAESARGNDPHGLRAEFIELVKKSAARQ